jgi:protein tyrosine phosphatase (PTP) superfamily phosphohydrolase (DUF442 family)
MDQHMRCHEPRLAWCRSGTRTKEHQLRSVLLL